MTSKEKRSGRRAADRKAWASPKVTFLGHVGGIVQGGGGKFSTMPVDPGEPRKTKPAG